MASTLAPLAYVTTKRHSGQNAGGSRVLGFRDLSYAADRGRIMFDVRQYHVAGRIILALRSRAPPHQTPELSKLGWEGFSP